MKNLHWLMALLVTAVLFNSACNDDEPAELDTSILSFTIVSPIQISGIVDNTTKTITLTVPFGTDLTAMTGAVSLPDGATISPDPTSAIDYSSAVTFTITNGASSSTYNVVIIVGANPLKLILIGDGDMANLSDETQNAYNWALTTYGNKAKYISFADLTQDDLDAASAIWWHYVNTVDRTFPTSATGSKKDMIKAWYEGGGNLLLTTHATGYLVELGRLTAEWGPTDGGLGNGVSDNPDDWGVGYTLNDQYDGGQNANHAAFQGITPKEVTFDGITYNAMMLIDGGSKRDGAWFWFANNIQGVIANFDTDGSGAIEADAELDTNGDGVFNNDDDVNARKDYFEQQTNSVVRGSFEWDPVANGVEFFTVVEFLDGGSYAGKAFTVSAGAYEWHQDDGRTNEWRDNTETFTSNILGYFGVE